MSTHSWYSSAKIVPSPHCDNRPDPDDISLLVIHNISLPPAEFTQNNIEAFFLGKLDASVHPFFERIRDMRVSAHCLIKRDGEVVQFVPFDKRAWHAGVSSFAGREKCNDFSIGIELEGTDYIAYTDAQYNALTALTHYLLERYPQIVPSRITGHQYIAPQRKTDPGLSFHWSRFSKMIAK
ncbi:N-acetyl-anhydromuranmyl-L-alanine amidase [Vibrio sp. UCD-FRSSP16_10]|uniref:1,6-anhydro-N-acetylmuramyl-L-alanine amidase AmpD n=1 Tax=unclassified Vibrio TaxID=2614977 RepID=UPI0007FE57A8|nr:MULTISPECIES: 1,6-anhydro-N-acetylmuramyl-L-alanine amidase AmpD [unclassified Vibrio]OBT17299.1 N-acetyl-anhydromuranmyl-L-alanine amidase [Vibrio sp. UCD-FRSSP16_30]OBT23068.1 N-acetyl-anhydromuranmyl-L-alanine amidase [Vibrio sp. UCD-FRSSP16_10]